MPTNNVITPAQRAIRKGYKQMAKTLGSKFGIYRPVSNDVPVTDVRNWQFDVYFSNALNTSYDASKQLGLPIYNGYFDNTNVITGDFVYDENRTFIVSDIPAFEPAVVIECFDTCTISSRGWDSATRTFAETVIVNSVPCNIQSMGSTPIQRDSESSSGSDNLQRWKIQTYLHNQSEISLNDVLVDSQGHKSYITNITRTQHGHTIECTEIKNDATPL